MTGLAISVITTAGLIVYATAYIPPSVQALNAKATAGISATAAFNGDIIGISDGSYAFDTNRSDGSLKQQASSKFRAGDKSGANSLWLRAVQQDTNDAEALIYLEDLRVLNSNKPYITLVVGTTITSKDLSATSIGSDILQGAYTAQKEYNDGSKQVGGKQLRLLIANSGSLADSATTVAQQIVQAVQHDSTLIGVMGWPFSGQTLSAVKVLSKVHIPMVSATSSSDDLTAISPFFFRVVPSNKSQAIAGALYLEQQLHAKKVALFLDPNNSYSSSLANDFSAKFINDGNEIVATEEYKVGDTTTMPLLLQHALVSKPDAIYFAGYASDLNVLLQSQPKLQIMGGDALYDVGGYTTTPPINFSLLHFTSFASPETWNILKIPDPPFFTLYRNNFDPQNQHAGAYGFVRPTGNTMLSYDAMLALLQGASNALTEKIALTPITLSKGLAKIYGTQAIQGITGQISFGSNGDPINKALLVLHVTSGYFTVVQAQGGVQGCFFVGQCSNTNG
ncbi:ABC transporter substrate-binding protein [Reticulibacter mediterranei]|nr:ABC transporter substrate-binding protein [Reticulibacter mediterranei]